MFMNTGIGKTGYSMIGQGRVSEIISQKSEERRIIFEEAAGISKYRFKKQEAEKRLKETDDNMTRILDIVSELDGRLLPLEKEAANAKVYLDLYEKKKKIDIALSVYDIQKINHSYQGIEKDYLLSKEELSLADEAIHSLDNRMERLSELQNESKAQYEKINQEISDQTNLRHKLESELLVSQNDALHLEHTLTSLSESNEYCEKNLQSKKNEYEKAHQNVIFQQQNGKKLDEDFDKLSSDLEKVRTEYAQAETHLASLLSQKEEILKQHTDTRISLSALQQSDTTISSRKDEIRASIESVEGKIVFTQEKIKTGEQTLLDYQKKLDDLAKKKDSLSSIHTKRSDTLAQQEKKYQTMLTEISSLGQRATTLRRMEEHFEGYSKSVKFVADAAERGRLTGICGPISHLITVDRKYSLAIETALGANLQNIIVENEQAAQNAIFLLKRENMGRSTFYPLTSIRPSTLTVSSSVKNAVGYIGIASELISYQSKYYPVLSFLLGRTLIFDSLDHASSVAKANGYSIKIVTLDGQVINAGGSFTGGSAKRDSGILTRNVEIEELLTAQKNLQNEAEKLQGVISDMQKQSEKEKNDVEQISEETSLFLALYNSEQTSLSLQKSRLKECIEEKILLEESDHKLNQQNQQKKIQEQELETRCHQLEETANTISQQVTSHQNEQEVISSRLNQLIDQKNQLLLSLSLQKKETEIASEKLSNLQQEMETLRTEQSRIQQQIKDSQNQSQQSKDHILDMEKELRNIDILLSTAEKSEKEISEKTLQLEKEWNDLRILSKEKVRERETIFTRYTSLSSKIESISSEKSKLTEKLWEDYELTFADATSLVEEEITDETRSKKISEQNKYRSKIRELGAVNVSAIEEYKTVKDRYEFLSGQVADLTKSKTEFTNIISKLETEMCKRFSETFEQINKNFKEVFTQLFDGGTASLQLTDPENVLTSGIEINVAPPGKIIKDLRSLSGGEQTFVAIGIYFAILKVNPSPFCLLDEIESALDEVNVERFAKYAKEFTQQTQFIIITHRRGTMEEADSLSGVTMQEKGISRILSIHVSEVEKKLGISL
jgi:chromosome segregation protein